MSVIIYGIGNMGRAVAALLIRNNITISCFIDKCIADREIISINGNDIPAFNPENITDIDHSCDVLVSMAAAPIYEIRDFMNSKGFYSVYPAGDRICELLPKIKLTNVWSLSKSQYDYIINNKFDDELSSIHWKIACEWFFKRGETTAKEITFHPDRKKYLIPLIMDNIPPKPVMIDSALLDGEYSRAFVDTTGGSSYVFKLHPESNCNIENNSIKTDERELFSCRAEITKSRIGLMEPFTSDSSQKIHTISIDEYCSENNIKPDFLRIYSISETLDIIIGAHETIRRHRPAIAVNIGHYLTDFISIPLFLKSYCDNYSFFFRIHSFQGNDCILYVLPTI